MIILIISNTFRTVLSEIFKMSLRFPNVKNCEETRCNLQKSIEDRGKRDSPAQNMFLQKFSTFYFMVSIPLERLTSSEVAR